MEHNHCDGCFSSNCESDEGCSVVDCPHCGTTTHSCKIEDHEYDICQELLIPCINFQHGCLAEVKRKHLREHLSICPAMLEVVVPSDIVQCESCSVSLNECDVPDHAKVCMEVEVHCVNKFFGCPMRMKRKLLNNHLEHCPASVIDCEYTYHRNSHSSQQQHLGTEKICKKSFNPLQLDEKFLLSDVKRSKEISSRTFGNLSMATNRESGFDCRECIRRDEFRTHWLSHIDFIDGLPQIVSRCPLFSYGCTYSTIFFQPAPCGYVLDFNPAIPSFVVKPPVVSSLVEPGNVAGGRYAEELAKKQELLSYGYSDEITGSVDVIGQLPVEVILLIMSFCDSLSLWCLSQVNRYLRDLCQEVVVERGVVHCRWEKEGVRWTPTPKSRYFTKVFAYSGKLLIQKDTPSMGEHLKHCNTFKRLQDNAKYQLESGLWNVHPSYPPFNQVAMQDADFERKEQN